MAGKKMKAPGENGPFTLKQVMSMADWPEWEKAGETELDTIESNETWVLCDEHEAFNQGAYIYDTRFVFSRKRDRDSHVDGGFECPGTCPEGKANGGHCGRV